jgi:hypothetical protein
LDRIHEAKDSVALMSLRGSRRPTKQSSDRRLLRNDKS